VHTTSSTGGFDVRWLFLATGIVYRHLVFELKAQPGMNCAVVTRLNIFVTDISRSGLV